MASTKRPRECIEAHRHSNAGSINRHVDPDAIMKACSDHSSLCPAPMPHQPLLTQPPAAPTSSLPPPALGAVIDLPLSTPTHRSGTYHDPVPTSPLSHSGGLSVNVWPVSPTDLMSQSHFLLSSFRPTRAPGSPSLDILTVYRPPRNDPTADARLIEDLERFSIRSEVLIMGDFNAPLIDWSSAYASGPDHAFDRRLLDMTFKLFLTQHVSFPTRVREGQQSNCLDLLLTKSLDSVDEVQCLPP
nr:unnamed protein product [Spirometra erinaceieuropaei]